MGKIIFSFILILLMVPFCYAQNDWKLQSDKDQIKTYSRKLSDSKINAVKLESVFACSMSQLVAVITDVTSYDRWIYNSKSTRLLKQVSATELYYYSEVVFPWPTTNRDFVSHVIIDQNPSSNIVTINANNVPGWVPVRPNLVRIDYSVGKWTLTPISKQETHVEYTLQVNPGGEIPVLLINSFSSTGMIKTFKNLREYLKRIPADFGNFLP